MDPADHCSPKEVTIHQGPVASQVLVIDKRQRPRVVPQIEVVNEIQIINKKSDNQRSVNNSNKSSNNSENSDKKRHGHRDSTSSSSTRTKCHNNDGNSSKYKIKNPEPDDPDPVKKSSTTTTPTANSADKPIGSSKCGKGSIEKGEKSEKTSAICVCGKLLRRVKDILEGNEHKVKSKY